MRGIHRQDRVARDDGPRPLPHRHPRAVDPWPLLLPRRVPRCAARSPTSYAGRGSDCADLCCSLARSGLAHLLGERLRADLHVFDLRLPHPSVLTHRRTRTRTRSATRTATRPRRADSLACRKLNKTTISPRFKQRSKFQLWSLSIVWFFTTLVRANVHRTAPHRTAPHHNRGLLRREPSLDGRFFLPLRIRTGRHPLRRLPGVGIVERSRM